jgi:nucleoside-diphosphate kinase
MADTPLYERSLVLLKPDAVQRGLIGEIISRFEQKGLKLTAMKMIWPSAAQAASHYDWSTEEKLLTGNRTLASYAEKGLVHPINDAILIAEDIQKRLIRYLTTGPIVALVIEGAHAVAHVRKIRGNTNPLAADVGTITGDFTIDSYFLSDPDARSIRNLVHASGSTGEAEREIKIWFAESDISDYKMAIDEILYSMKWEEVAGQIVGERQG